VLARVDDADQAMRKGLTSDKSVLRVEVIAVLALQRHGLPVMIEATRHPDAKIRRLAIEWLGQAQVDSVESIDGRRASLSNALNDADAQVRLIALRLVHQLEPPPFAPGARGLLADPDLRVKIEATKLAVEMLPSGDVLEALPGPLHDPEPAVRAAGAESLVVLLGMATNPKPPPWFKGANKIDLDACQRAVAQVMQDSGEGVAVSAAMAARKHFTDSQRQPLHRMVADLATDRANPAATRAAAAAALGWLDDLGPTRDMVLKLTADEQASCAPPRRGRCIESMHRMILRSIALVSC
jgi:hypothetical protein